MVAALFVDPQGPYPKLGLDCWDEARDARRFFGPGPVIAHPPCQLWGNFAAINFARWGGEHNRPGNDGGCFAHALACVREFGGVLEHPANSRAWPTFSLPKPNLNGGWTGGPREWVCEVWQSAYGHKAQKRTWLFYCGPRPPEANWAQSPGTHQIGYFDIRKPVLSKAEASRTPLAFADFLVKLAHAATLKDQ